jgi:fructose-bisphosphate aldolase class II
MNIDTDLQFAFAEGIRDYMIKTLTIWKLKSVEGSDVQKKKYYDPRKWMRESEMTFNARLEQAFADLNNVNTL